MLSRPQGHGTVGRNMSLKNPVTPLEIDPGTVRLVAQRLKHYANPGPRSAQILVNKLCYCALVFQELSDMAYI